MNVFKKRENIPYVYNAQNYIQNTYSNNLQIIKIVIWEKEKGDSEEENNLINK